MQNEKVPAAMQDNVTQGWEIFCDPSYFDMWCIRKEGDKRWGAGVHVVSQDGAEAVRDYIIASTTAQTEAVQKLVDALAYAEPYVETLHSLLLQNAGPKNEAVKLCWKAVTKVRAALAAHRESQP